jgi:ATP/maltotriose-dependent transcriptional regulator MalT
MIGVGRATELLEQARELAKARKFREVTDLLGDLSLETVAEEPELGILRSVALSYQCQHPNAKKNLELIRHIIEGSEDASLMWRWNNSYGVQLTHHGLLEEAETILLACLVNAERTNNLNWIWQATTNLGVIASVRGDVEHALTLNGRALVTAQRIGELYGIGAAHHNSGIVLREWARYDEAASHFAQAHEYFSQSSIPEEIIFTSTERAQLFSCLGDHMLGEELIKRTLSRSREVGNQGLICESLKIYGVILTSVGRLDEARGYLAEASKLGATLYRLLLRAELAEAQTDLELSCGDRDKARGYLDTAIAHYLRLGATAHVERLRYRYRAL